MSIGDLRVKDFLDQLASPSPVPGGGAVSALAGAMAAALVSMVANLTVGRKKFEAKRQQLEPLLVRSEELRADLLKLADRDIQAFQLVMAAYGMPRGTPQEEEEREQHIQAALKEAASVPAEVVKLSIEVMNLAKKAREHGNPNAASDADVSFTLAAAAAQGAMFNVLINLESITDKEFVLKLRKSVIESEVTRGWLR